MDHDASRIAVIDGLTRRGMDVLTTRSAGNTRLADDGQLQFAFENGRVMYSANRHDFARLHSLWMKAGREHAGIIVRARQLIDPAEEIRALLGIAEHYELKPMHNVLLFLENWTA